jgi:large subunit ribosomal protein L29
MMKVKELRDMTVEELDQQLQDFKKEVFNLRLQQATAQLENAARIKDLRRSIARLKTIQNEKARG